MALGRNRGVVLLAVVFALVLRLSPMSGAPPPCRLQPCAGVGSVRDIHLCSLLHSLFCALL